MAVVEPQLINVLKRDEERKLHVTGDEGGGVSCTLPSQTSLTGKSGIHIMIIKF